jgi:hypothetical protein
MLRAQDGARHAHIYDWLLDFYDGESRPLTHDEYVAWLALRFDQERNGAKIANPDEFRVFDAYCDLLLSKGGAPLISELLERLGVEKPKLTERNRQEWEKVNNRERVIRKMLKKAGLTLSEGKRGRRW